MNQRSDFKEAKQKKKKTVPRIYSNHWKWKQTYPSRNNKSDKGLVNSLKALKNTIIDLKFPQDADTIFLTRRIHLRHHDGNQAATCGQHGVGIRGTRHPGLNSHFFFFNFSSLHVSWQSTGGTVHLPRTTYSHAQLLRSLVAVLLSE